MNNKMYAPLRVKKKAGSEEKQMDVNGAEPYLESDYFDANTIKEMHEMLMYKMEHQKEDGDHDKIELNRQYM